MGTPIKVKHSELNRPAEAPNNYVSVCPSCPDGVLLLRMDIETRELLERDICIQCGQEFIYEDIAQLREAEPGAQKR